MTPYRLGYCIRYRLYDHICDPLPKGHDGADRHADREQANSAAFSHKLNPHVRRERQNTRPTRYLEEVCTRTEESKGFCLLFRRYDPNCKKMGGNLSIAAIIKEKRSIRYPLATVVGIFCEKSYVTKIAGSMNNI